MKVHELSIQRVDFSKKYDIFASMDESQIIV